MMRSMLPPTWTGVDRVDQRSMRSMSRGAWTTEINEELSSLLARSGWSGSLRGVRNSAA